MSEEPSVKRQKKNVAKIATHSGTFHADECLAIALLKHTVNYSDAEVIRTRDSTELEKCDLVVDVGGKFEPPKWFDHHQRNFKETFKNRKTKLSSAGLIYIQFGKEVIRSIIANEGKEIAEFDDDNVNNDDENDDEKIDWLFERIYRDFIEVFDAYDNGISKFKEEKNNGLKKFQNFTDDQFNLASIVNLLNPSWDINEKERVSIEMENFKTAIQILDVSFIRFVKYLGISFLGAKKYVLNAIKKRENGILVLEKFVPWKEHLFLIEKELKCVGKCIYIIFPDSTKQWRIAAVPVTSSSFESRKKLPQEWRGLRDDELSLKTGIKGCTFVHSAGFIGGGNSKESVLKMAQLAISL